MILVGKAITEPLAARREVAVWPSVCRATNSPWNPASADGDLHATWRAILRDGSPYLHQQVTFVAGKRPIPVKEIILIDIPLAAARSSGSVNGSRWSPTRLSLPSNIPCRSIAARWATSAVPATQHGPHQRAREFPSLVGYRVCRQGTVAAGFLAYLERGAGASLPAVSELQHLVRHRLLQPFRCRRRDRRDRGFWRGTGEETQGTRVDSFLLDDGWDDCKSLWRSARRFS